MLQQLFHITIVSLICVLWGIPMFLALKITIDKDDFWYRSPAGLLSFLFFLGCITISLISSWVGLVAPLRFSYLLFGTVIPVSYLFLFRRKKIKQIFRDAFKNNFSYSAVHISFLFLAVCLFLLLSSLAPVNGDTQIYHLQVIRWQHEYGTVPGIANLYPRLGLNSNWLNLISLFYWPSLSSENFTYLNATFVIWFFTWLFSTWHFHFKNLSIKKGSAVLSLFYFLLILYGLFDWQLFRDAANSTNFDFAVIAFLLMIFSYFIEGIFERNGKTSLSPGLLLFAFALIGFKFSGIFIILLIVYYLFDQKRFLNWILVGSIACLFLIPVFIRNYITSGYPFFPGTFAIAAPDWQLPGLMAEKFYRYILLSNKFYNHRLSFAYNFHLTAFNWIPFWVHGILLKHKVILGLSLLSFVFLFVKPPLTTNRGKLRQLIVVLFLMIAAWFFSAPDPGRFGYGMLLTSAFLFVSLVLQPFFNPKIFNPVLVITMLIMCYYIFEKSDRLSVSRYCAVPVPIVTPAYRAVKLDGLELHLPNRIRDNSDYRCYFTPLPCITQENPYLRLRGESLKQGFRMQPHPDSNFILNYNY